MTEGASRAHNAGQTAAADLLEAARRAAADGRPDEMITALAASHFLDGLKGRLSREWQGRLPESETDECIAVAVDSAFEAVGGGKSITNLGAWLWKAANNKAYDRWHSEYALRTDAEIEDLRVADDLEDGSVKADDELIEYRRKEAIRLARHLLPRIGQGQLVDVMSIVIDAVEQGVQDLPPTAIANSLGISADSVRALLSRGFERLSREARHAGIQLPSEMPEMISSSGLADELADSMDS